MFLAITENKLIMWNYRFSGPTGTDLYEFSNINSRIKCEICSKLTIEAPDVVLSFFEYTWHVVQVFFLVILNMEMTDGTLYCLNPLNDSVALIQ